MGFWKKTFKKATKNVRKGIKKHGVINKKPRKKSRGKKTKIKPKDGRIPWGGKGAKGRRRYPPGEFEEYID